MVKVYLLHASLASDPRLVRGIEVIYYLVWGGGGVAF